MESALPSNSSSTEQQRLQEELFPIDEGEKTIEKLEGKLLRKKFVLDVVSY